MTEEQIRGTVRQVLRENFTIDPAGRLPDHASFLGSGAIDSAGIVRLIVLLEQRFAIRVPDEEVTAENFDSILRVGEYVCRKLEH